MHYYAPFQSPLFWLKIKQSGLYIPKKSLILKNYPFRFTLFQKFFFNNIRLIWFLDGLIRVFIFFKFGNTLYLNPMFWGLYFTPGVFWLNSQGESIIHTYFWDIYRRTGHTPFGCLFIRGCDKVLKIGEMLKIIDFPDRGVKPIAYTMESSGMQMVSWD